MMKYGSDDEKALTKAIDHSFPGSSRVLCTKHLKDNLQHYLTHVAAVKQHEYIEIKDLVFGDNGLVNAEDSFEVEQISTKIASTTDNKQFQTYFAKFFKDRVNAFVTIPRQRERQKGKLWTNNNSESLSNVLKMAVDWNPKATPELLEAIYNVVNLQFKDTRRALYGTGNYRLAPKYCNYTIPEMTWKQKSEDQKETLLMNFLKDNKKRPLPDKIVSANGVLSLPNKARRIATKPGQRKRGRNERTVSKR